MQSHLPGTSDKKSLPKIKPTTARKRTMKALPASEQQRLLALEASGIGTWCWDVVSDVVELDSQSRVLFGLPEAQSKISRQNLLSHLHPDDRKETEEGLKRLVETRGDYDIVQRVILPDNSLRWVRCKGRFLGQQLTPARGLAIDVSWAQRSEDQLLKVQKRLSRVNDELERRVQERTAELERTMAQATEQSKMLDLANDAIFVRGADDRVSYWNKGAERLYGWNREEAIGHSTHELLGTVFPAPLSEILNSDRWEGELQHTKRDGTTITVASRWTTLRDSEKRPVGWLELNTDISPRKASEEAAIRLSSRILKVQDEERRKMGRELHDGVGQYLTSLKINLDLLLMEQSAEQRCGKFGERLSECLEVLDKCIAETRTLSHLLHPPLLDEAGLASAARWYVEGFAKRSNLRVNVDITGGLPRLASNAELALFRVLQEGLTNVYRHSGCSIVEVAIQSNPQGVMLKVRDNGRGIGDDTLRALSEGSGELGIGLAGMRERLRQLGGHLEVRSSNEGTTVIAVVPFSPTSEIEGNDAVSTDAA
jgi:PAS domain S-box-containing protein